MTTCGFPCIVKYDGIEEDDIEDEADLSTTYVAIKKQPFYTTLAAYGRPGFFSYCTARISLHYYDSLHHIVSSDEVTFVNIFPVHLPPPYNYDCICSCLYFKIEYKTRVNANGTEMEVESIIYALSSQHQGMLFSVVIEGMPLLFLFIVNVICAYRCLSHRKC